jgi:hypothetical protein
MLFFNKSIKFESCLLYPDNDPNKIGIVSKFIQHMAAKLVYLPQSTSYNNWLSLE